MRNDFQSVLQFDKRVLLYGRSRDPADTSLFLENILNLLLMLRSLQIGLPAFNCMLFNTIKIKTVNITILL